MQYNLMLLEVRCFIPELLNLFQYFGYNSSILATIKLQAYNQYIGYIYWL